MGKPAVSPRIKLISLCTAAFLACGLLPFAAYAVDSQAIIASQVGASSDVASALADQVNDSTDSSSDDSQQVSASQDARASRVAPMLASGLFGSPAAIISSDVALDAADPIVGSFTADGLTYAVNNGEATLVSVAGPLAGPEGNGSAEGGFANISIPASVAYNGTDYDVTAIGPYAFYLSGATSVDLPDPILSVDDRAFRSSDVGAVSVDPANPNLASFDGALYSADESRLLLIPEGRKGSVLLSCETGVVEASLFSHCSLVEAISVEEGGAAFSSWNGCLYDASGTTLLRVPAGATEITIREGCTTIAAGAMEGCAKLERINAPATVTSISPDVFTSIPTVSLPAQSALHDGSQDDSVAGPLAGPGYEDDARSASADSAQAEGEEEMPGSAAAPQLTAMVALSSADDDLPEVGSSSIEVSLSEGADAAVWQAIGLFAAPIASVQNAAALNASFDVYGGTYFEGPKDTVIIRAVCPYAPWDSRYRGDDASVWVKQDPYPSPAKGPFDYVYSVYTLTGGKNIFSGGLMDEGVQLYNGILVAKDKYWGTTETTPTTEAQGYAYELYMPGSITGRFADNVLNYSGAAVVNGWKTTTPNYINSAGSSTWGAYLFTVAPGYIEKATLTFSTGEGAWGDGSTSRAVEGYVGGTLAAPEAPSRTGYDFLGWTTNADSSEPEGGYVAAGASISVSGDATYYAAWKKQTFQVGFDTSSEPGDEDAPGDAMDDKPVEPDDGQVPIEDPKRPGYVFEGWVIPTEDGTEAVDQDLVYQGDDGTWYVDASKLPDYAGDDGRVELTARWTSVISVDVPSSVTFYADLVTQGQESREGAAEGAFGQSKVANQSQVDLRVVGLESSAVKTEGTTLGADSVLKKADAATPSTSTQKLLSLYPSAKQWTADELRDPDAVGGTKAATAVDFDLDDVLLEKSFSADDFTIAAGGTLNMGYRLNLSETGQQLDYDKLSTLSEGQSASLANVSYCFGVVQGSGPTNLDAFSSTGKSITMIRAITTVPPWDGTFPTNPNALGAGASDNFNNVGLLDTSKVLLADGTKTKLSYAGEGPLYFRNGLLVYNNRTYFDQREGSEGMTWETYFLNSYGNPFPEGSLYLNGQPITEGWSHRGGADLVIEYRG